MYLYVQQTDRETILIQVEIRDIGPAESCVLEFLRVLRRHTHKYIYIYLYIIL